MFCVIIGGMKMNNQKTRNELIDQRLDEFNASSALEGMDLSPEKMEELKEKLKSGKTVEECVQEVVAEFKTPK